MSKFFRKSIYSVFTTLTFLMTINGVHAEETKATTVKNSSQVITIETTTLRGNQELPTVLYLVPWQAPEVRALQASQTLKLSKTHLAPLNRESFIRGVQLNELGREQQLTP